MSAQPITHGCRVTMRFSLHLADGTLVDESRDGEPLTVVVGQGDLMPCLEQRLMGLRTGEAAHFEIGASDACGRGTDDNVHALARDSFPPDMPLDPGVVLEFTLPSGEEVAGTVLGVTAGEVTVDFSHPLAGHDLVFDVEILSVEVV